MISKEEMVREIFKDINLRPVAKDIRIDKVLKNFSYEEIEEVLHYNDDLIPASWKKTRSETSNNYPMES